jgi:hypothetical protein
MQLHYDLCWCFFGQETAAGSGPATHVISPVATDRTYVVPIRQSTAASADGITSPLAALSPQRGLAASGPPACAHPGQNILAADADDVVLGDLGAQLARKGGVTHDVETDFQQLRHLLWGVPILQQQLVQ